MSNINSINPVCLPVSILASYLQNLPTTDEYTLLPEVDALAGFDNTGTLAVYYYTDETTKDNMFGIYSDDNSYGVYTVDEFINVIANVLQALNPFASLPRLKTVKRR